MNKDLREKLLYRLFSDPKYMEEMVIAHGRAIYFAIQAVDSFYKNPMDGWDSMPIWDTPKIWEDRVIPNFQATQASMEEALKLAYVGDFNRMKRVTQSLRGIAKNMDGIGWGWWSSVDKKIEDEFGINFEISKQNAENIYWTLRDGWKPHEILKEGITGPINDSTLIPHLKSGETI